MVSATTSIYHTYTFRTGASVGGFAQIDHEADSFRVLLLRGYTFDNDHSVESQVTANELSAADANYTAGGLTIGNTTFTLAASGTATFDGDNVIVTASGGDLSARFAVVVASVAASTDKNPLLFLIDFTATQTAGDGTTFNINWSADGIVQIKPG